MSTPKALEDGAWLCPPGPYLDRIKSLIPSDPRLKHRDAKAVSQRTLWPPSKSRIVNLELQAGDNSFQQTAEWSNAQEFRRHLELNAASISSGRNVILVEGLSPELVDVLGTRFGIHPSFFVDHERVVVFNTHASKSSDLGFLPSIANWNAGVQGVTLKYFEPLKMSPGPPDFRLSCMESGRHVGAFRLRGQIAPVVVVRRKCSIWNVVDPGGGYTSIIVCDPPLTAVSTRLEPGGWERQVLPVHCTPYQGGYMDFMLHENSNQGISTGPPRTSLLADLRHYLTNHSAHLPDPHDPKSAALFVQKIVASHYFSLTSFVSSVLSTQQFDLSRQQDMARFALNTVEQQWSGIQSWERRLYEYISDIDDAMLKLCIPFLDPDTRLLSQNTTSSTWHSATSIATDYQFLHKKLVALRDRAQQINAATSGLAGIAGNRRAYAEQQVSLRETQRTKALTMVGLVFIPLAYTATLFSMNERFMPGAKSFWIYFVVSGPVVGAVVVGYFFLDWVYGGGKRSGDGRGGFGLGFGGRKKEEGGLEGKRGV